MNTLRSLLAFVFLIALVAWAKCGVLAAGETEKSLRQKAGAGKGVFEPGQIVAPETEETTQPASPKEKKWTHPEIEFRGIWLPGRDILVSTDSLMRKLDNLARANFNAVFPDAYFRGYVIYPNSKYLPQLPEAKSTDPLAVIVQEAHRRGLQVHAWLEYGFYAYHTPDATKNASMGPWLDAHPELLSVNAKGERYIHNPAWGDFYSMCPSNPRCHELIANIAAEILERYPVEGINLDRIRYAGETYCYCNYCKEHFKKDTGIDLVAFAKGSQEEKRFLEWKRAQLVKAVETIRKRVKGVRPNVILTSYVVPPAEKDNKAQ
ncbi:MAG: family 10 glycosylhydrolase, partial [Candidatus Sumerlaeaceae bacterium]|nr:family 10 glycosylhydrolase [Candidatus Sumerlaeaceae bacterium]